MRTFVMGMVALLGSTALLGCSGSSFQDTLGTGSGPQPAKGQPVVTGVSPASVVVGGAGFTLAVSGKNFAQGDTVEWNTFSLPSTYVSSTKMTAQVPGAVLYEAGSAMIIVQTPVPYSLNFGTSLTIVTASPPGSAGFTVTTANVQANDMVWDPVSGQIYLSVAGTDALRPNTVTALDPATGQFGASVSAGPGANRLGVSSDGAWLYAGIDPNGVVQRFVLPGLASDITIPLGSDSSGKQNVALDLQPSPNSPNTIAVARASSSSFNSTGGSVAIYDGAVARSEAVSNFGENDPIGSLAWNGTGSHLYATFNYSDFDNLFDLSVNAAGAQLLQNEQLMTGDEAFPLGIIHYSALTGQLLSDDCTVIDPTQGTVVGHLPKGAIAGGTASDSVLTLDDNLGAVWMVAKTGEGPGQEFTIAAFDLRTDALLGSIAVPNVVGTPIKLIRWGANGLAFLTSGTNGPRQGDGVYLIRGEFVTTPSVMVSRPPGL